MTCRKWGEILRIVYIGCVESSYVFLKALLEAGADIVGVVTKESSSFNSDFRDITPLCEKYKIPYNYTKNSNDEATYQFIMKCKPDLAFCFGWSQLISEKVIDSIPLGMVGFHPAALPYNRGRHPIIWALALGLSTTASSFFMMEKEADTGDIVSQVKIDILETDDASTLMKRILEVGSKQVVELWRCFENNTVSRKKQDIAKGNSWRKRGKIDGQIDWRMSSKSIYNLVRALTKPYVGAHFVYKDKDIKVWSVEEILTSEYNNIEPGKIIDINNDKSVLVKAGDNLIKLIDFDRVELKIGDYL